MIETEEKPKHRIGLLVWLIVSQLLTGVSLFLCFFFALSKPPGFDSETQAFWPLVSAICWIYPIFPIAMVIGAWSAFARRKNVLSAILSGLSCAPLLLCGCVFVFLILGEPLLIQK